MPKQSTEVNDFFNTIQFLLYPRKNNQILLQLKKSFLQTHQIPRLGQNDISSPLGHTLFETEWCQFRKRIHFKVQLLSQKTHSVVSHFFVAGVSLVAHLELNPLPLHEYGSDLSSLQKLFRPKNCINFETFDIHFQDNLKRELLPFMDFTSFDKF